MTHTYDRTYTYEDIDKKEWGEGEWLDEFDKYQWVDEATGLDCLIRRNAHSGVLCGYVGVPSDHPLHGHHYDEPDVFVHGGLTFAASCDDDAGELGICHIPLPGRDPHVWWFGFDCGHFADLCPGWASKLPEDLWPGDCVYRTVEYVRAECEDLAKQLKQEAA